MNKAFTKSKKILLSENYYVAPDNAHGVVLVNHFDIEAGDEDLEVFTKTIENKLYFPRVAQALRKYVDLELIFEDSIEELIEKTEKVYALIESIDKNFKQF